MKKKTNYELALDVLKELHETYPTTPLSQHIYSSLADYGNFWGVADKELLFAFQKYQSEMEMNVTSEKEIEKIVEEGKNLDKLFLEEDAEEEWP